MFFEVEQREERKKNVLRCLAVLGISILCGAVYLYIILHEDRPFTSDDAETPIHFYNHLILGYDYPNEIKLRYLSVFNLLCVFTYKVFGCTIFASQLVFAERFTICVMISLLLVVFHEGNKKYNLISVPVYIFMTCFLATSEPGIMSSKFHTDPVVFVLLFFLIYEKKEVLQRKYKVLVAILTISVILQIDFLMLPIYFVPLAIYIYREEMAEDNKKRILKIVVYILAAGAVFLGIANILTQNLGVTLSGFTGYGGKRFSTINEIGENIVIMIQGIADMFNASVGGDSMISLSVIAPIIKMILIVMAFIIMIDSLVKKEKNVIYYCSLNVIAVILTFIFSGEHNLYDVRYLSSVLFVLPIILCIKIKEIITWAEGKNICLQYMNFFVPVICLFLGISQISIIPSTEMEELQNLCDVLEKEELKNGISSFWSANIVTVMSNYKQNVQAVVFTDEGKVTEEMDTWEFFKYKANEVNYVIVDKNMEEYMVSDYGINKNSVTEKYGEPEKLINVGERQIYIYNYDIRNEPISMTGDDFWVNSEATSGRIAKGKYGTTENVVFEVGTYLIYVETKGDAKNSDIDIWVDDKKCRYVNEDDGKLIFEIQVPDYREVNEISIYNNGNSDVVLKSVNVFPVREAMNVCVEGKSITEENVVQIGSDEYLLSDIFEVNKGVYDIVGYGDDIECLEISASEDNEDISFEKIQQNKTSVVYKLYVEENSKLQFKFQNKGNETSEITNVSLEVDDEYRTEMFDVSDLECSKGHKTESKIILDENGLQYGPYCKLEKGDYEVEVYGDGLSDVEAWVTADVGQTSITIDGIEKEQQKIHYIVHVDDEYNDVEFLIKNSQESDVSISYIIVRNMNTYKN